MSSMGAPQVPPWLQEKIVTFQKTQQELQTISMQKQQLEVEKINITRTLEELKKANEDEAIFKISGNVMIKTTKTDTVSDLEEKLELGNTRTTIINKQEARLQESLKEQEMEITRAMKGGAGAPPPPPSPPPSPSSPPPSPQTQTQTQTQSTTTSPPNM